MLCQCSFVIFVSNAVCDENIIFNDVIKFPMYGMLLMYICVIIQVVLTVLGVVM